jgi:hypothetical protein
MVLLFCSDSDPLSSKSFSPSFPSALRRIKDCYQKWPNPQARKYFVKPEGEGLFPDRKYSTDMGKTLVLISVMVIKLMRLGTIRFEYVAPQLTEIQDVP